jgi:hypothetical protein
VASGRTRAVRSPVAGHGLGALAVCLLLTACSSNGGDATEVVREAPDKTIDAGSARATLSLGFMTGGSPATIRGDGVFDLRNRLGGLTVDLGALGTSFGGAPVEAVIAAEGLFVKLPPGENTGGRPWLKLDLATLSRQAGLNLGSLAQLQQSDPTQVLTYLKGALDDVKEVGEETQRGEDTTHYRGTIDLRKATASLPPEAQSGVEDAIASLGTSTLPADVWIDDDGRIRRLSFSADPDAEGPNPPGKVDIELYDFGVTADIGVPPPDQVTDLTNLFGTAPR